MTEDALEDLEIRLASEKQAAQPDPEDEIPCLNDSLQS